MKKNILVLSLCLTSVLALSGCMSGGNDTNAGTTPSASPSTGITGENGNNAGMGSTSSSTDTGEDSTYHADSNGTVDGNGQNGTGSQSNGGNANGSTSKNSEKQNTTSNSNGSEDGLLNNVGNAVDNLVEDAKKTVRDAT